MIEKFNGIIYLIIFIVHFLGFGVYAYQMIINNKKFRAKFEKFMGFMQSDKGMAVRKTIAHVEKTVPAIAPDKSYVMFKVSVHNEEEMKKFASGNNPIAKPIFDECVEIVQMFELSKVKL